MQSQPQTESDAAGLPHYIPGDTVAEVFWRTFMKRSQQVALRQKELGIWISITNGELANISRELGEGLLAVGFQRGECVSILSNTVREWLYADLGALFVGGVSSGIYPTDSAEQTHYLMADSASTILFVEDEEQLDKALAVREQLPLLRRVVVFDMEGLQKFDDPSVISLDGLRALGRARMTEAGADARWEQGLSCRQVSDLAILIYTSGTTGKPKGAMLSHGNVVASIRGLRRVVDQDERDQRMCFLPLCHAAERIMGAYLALYSGTCLNFVENPQTIPENVREIAPTVFLAVPRIWEKFYSASTIALSEATPLEKWAYARALKVGYDAAPYLQDGKPLPVGLAVRYWLARTLVLNNTRRLLGIHRCRFIITGAAPISPDLIRWYLALGIPVREIWGQTEAAGGGTATPVGKIKPGWIGPASPMNEVKLDPQTSELLIRGPNVFMGYLNLPEKTAETLDAEGWLHTGDVGRVDEDGYFKIVDRMKDIIITAGGKNITPSEIENELKFSPYITDAVVIGDRRAYLTALIMIDLDNVVKYAQDHDIPFSDYVSLCRAQAIQNLVENEMQAVNAKFARVEQVKAFRLIETQLTAEDEELTPTMKLKRKFVNAKYADLIESMY
ncbi:AMP-dependent synthetase/ligase [Ottowia thiooxydans]|uniref:AMP-dependent synthetase/ligase n=1 Tax=Ottowia thiooxydans TaxID=219182 RepID=UPI000412B410|nr:long-chain fatty acid--CoA ligase [Ottowia thiooxydans]